jgi:hypothetical protein
LTRPNSSDNPCQGDRKTALSTYNQDGSLRWNVESPAGARSQASPIADHGVIFSGLAGSASAVHVSDGSMKWHEQLGTAIYSLWLINGVLVANVDQVSDDPKLVGLDPANGTTRWTYPVPGGGFLGDAVLSGDGGLAFRTGDTGILIVLDTSSGHVRWSRQVGGGRNDGGLPSAASGLVLYVDPDHQMFALDARTGAVRWQVRADQSGHVIVSQNVGVVMPDAISGPSVTVVAHSLDNGAVVWRHQLADIAAVFPDQAGFMLADYRANTMTLVEAATGNQVWEAQVGRVENLDQPPISLAPDGALAVLDRNGMTFVDRNTGTTRQVSTPLGIGQAAASDTALFVVGATHLFLVTDAGVSWTVQLPHFAQLDPTPLDDGGVAVQSEDPICASI